MDEPITEISQVTHDPLVAQDSLMVRVVDGAWKVEHTVVTDQTTRTTEVTVHDAANYEAALALIRSTLPGKPVYIDESARAVIDG